MPIVDPGRAIARRWRWTGRYRALEGGVGTDPGGEFEHSLGGRIAPLLDQVGGTELQGELLSLRVPAEGDDPLGAESPGRQDRREADCPVADDRHRVASLDPGTYRRMVPRGHDVRQGQEGLEHVIG